MSDPDEQLRNRVPPDDDWQHSSDCDLSDQQSISMSEKYAIIARYTEGVPKYWIGKKMDSNQPLNENNVQWKTKDGVPLIFKENEDARIALG